MKEDTCDGGEGAGEGAELLADVDVHEEVDALHLPAYVQ
jgi:hypothetical protein